MRGEGGCRRSNKGGQSNLYCTKLTPIYLHGGIGKNKVSQFQYTETVAGSKNDAIMTSIFQNRCRRS